MSIYRLAMRVGSQILFWLSVLVVLLSILTVYETLEQAQAQMGLSIEGLRTFTRFKILLSAVAQSLLLGALPFGAAVIIHRIDKFLATRQGSRE